MIHRDQHTRLTITTPALDPRVLTNLSEDLSPTIALDVITNFTSLLNSRIEHTLTHHQNQDQDQDHQHQDQDDQQHTQNTHDAHDSGDSRDDDEHVEALLSMRNGAAMAGARRLELIATTALNQSTKGSITVEPLIRQLTQEAQSFKAAAARAQHPTNRLAA